MLSDPHPTKVGKWSEPALRVLRERYLTRKDGKVVETPEEMCWRVAESIAAAEARYGRSPAAVREISTAFYDIMVDAYFLPNSPTLMNAGKGTGLQYSACYVLPVGDSMEEIFDSVKAAAMIHKCLVGDTLVMSDGLRRLDEVEEGHLVATDEGPFHASALHDNGEQPVIEVQTNRGYKVTGTADHKLLAVDADGTYRWRRIGDLHAGDWLVMKPGQWVGGATKLPAFAYAPRTRGNATSFKAAECSLPAELSPELAELVGLYVGDGSNHRDGIRFTVGDGDADVLRRIEALSLALFDKRPSVSRHTEEDAVEVAILSTRVKQWFAALGFTKTSSREARIPDRVLRSTEEVACAFVRGLFTADGCVRENGHITLTTSSSRLAAELQVMLLALGVPTEVREDVSTTGYHSWQVSVCTKAGFLRFRERIGFASQRKSARLAAVSPDAIFVREETVPNQRRRLRAWYDALPAPVRRSAKRVFDDLLNRATGPRELTRQRIDAALHSGAPCPPFFAEIAAEDVFFVRVTDVHPDGVRRVWDLTVPHKHAYLANGFVSHNSGGGTGFAFSRLRPKDDVVASTGGRASGPVSFLKVFNAATEAVKQGGTRRGANMGILRVDHPDILEFIDCKLDGGITNFNISVAATEVFMEALAKGEEYDLINPHTRAVVGRLSAKEVFDRIVRAAWRTGDPGMIFIDRVNASPANPTPEIGAIEATNPCIVGDTLVATDRGLLRMDHIAAQYAAGGVAVKVDPRLMPERLLLWEGTHNVPLTSYDQECLPISRAFSSGEREIVRVTTKAGFELKCTPDHRLMTERGWVRAEDLHCGTDRVFIQSGAGSFGADTRLPIEVRVEFPGEHGHCSRHALPTEWSEELGLVLGWLVGDGWLRSGDRNCRIGFTFARQDAPIFERLRSILDSWYGQAVVPVEREGGVQHLSYHGKFFVAFFEALGVRPVSAADKVVPATLFRAPREAVVGFLRGLFTADGTVRKNPRPNSAWIALTSKSRDLLRGVQLLLLALGIKSQIIDRSRTARRGLFAYEASDGPRTYASDGVLYELGIFGKSRELFRREVGFLNEKQQRLDGVTCNGFYRQQFTDVVHSVESAGIATVFDLTEPQSHTMIANGFVIHQCGEQPLLPNEACNLGSLNVSKFARRSEDGEWSIDWEEMERVVRLAVRFLDDVIEMNPYPLPQIDEMVKANRRIGLGIMGWADLLFLLGIPYDSQEAVDLAGRLMAFVNEKGHDQSARLAEERGPFPNWSRSIYATDRPLRNSTVTTIAPTGTISMIGGCSSGIEPIFALAFEHRVKQPDGERVLTFVNETFEAIAKDRGFYSSALMQEIARRGTLHGIPGVPEEAARVFKTAHDVAPEWHVRHQAAFQQYTDNGVSKTINLPNDATEEDVAAAYRLAWELGCLGITVFRDGCKGEQVLTVGVGAPAKKETPLALSDVVKPRPHSLTGTTYRMATPIGTAFVTVNETPDGDAFEVFVQVGKAGSDTMAVAEALGRLVSLILRMPSPFSARRRLEEVISQLSRIGGGQPTGFGPAKVLSLPDALARTLAEHLGLLKGEPTPGAAAAAQAKRIGDLCKECGQATFIYEEGCKKCLSCGFNEC